MLHIDIKSYDDHFDTFAVSIQDHSSESVFESLIPAVMLPYIAPQLVSELEDLPYDCVGKSFDLHLPKQLFTSN